MRLAERVALHIVDLHVVAQHAAELHLSYLIELLSCEATLLIGSVLVVESIGELQVSKLLCNNAFLQYFINW